MATTPDAAVTQTATAQPNAVPSRASVPRRLAAGLVDAVVLSAGLAVVIGTGLAIATSEEVDWALTAWALVFAPLYFALYHAFGAGGTPGQLELRLAMRDERTAGLARPGRTLARSYLGLAFGVLVVPVLVDVLVLAASRRSLRDRITRTTVVRVSGEGIVPELTEPTASTLRPIFEPSAGTRRHLRRGWALVRARPRLLLGSVATVYAVLLALAAVLALLIVADAPSDPWSVGLFVLVATALLVSGAYWTQAVTVLAVEEARVGDEPSVGRVLVRATRRVNALSAALVLLLALGGLTFLLILPVLLAGRVALVAPALVLEDRRVLGAFGRSWELTAGQTWRALGLSFVSLLLLGAVLFAAVAAPTALADAGGFGPVAAVVAALFALAALVGVVAWLGAAWSLVYEDSRRRLPPREESGCSR